MSAPLTHFAWVGNDSCYTLLTTFETFPLPPGMTPDVPAAALEASSEVRAIGVFAAELDRLRNAWLNPPDLVWVKREVVSGHRDRVLPRDETAAATRASEPLQRASGLVGERPCRADSGRSRLMAGPAGYRRTRRYSDRWR